MKKLALYLSLVLSVLAIFIAYEYFKYADNNLRVIVCDVGQGDGILIITPTQGQILIDGGPDKSVLDCLGRNMPFWDRSLDMVILTHQHADHYSGLIHVVDRYHLDGFYTQEANVTSEGYKLLEAKLAVKNLSAKYLVKGDKFKDKSGVEIKILWPSLDRLKENNLNISNTDLNESSIVAHLSYANFSVLLTGDAELNVLNLLDLGSKRINILKVPHHGSSGGASDELLDKIKPDLGVISVGENNKFGHPTKETLGLLSKHGIKTLRTDANGEIEIISDGSQYSVKSKK